MEEREKSLSDDNNRPLFDENDTPCSQSHETTNAILPTRNTPLPVSSQPVFRSGTYVVQVPKDQIYRVPPPENALMLAEHQENQHNRSSCCFCCSSSLFVLFRSNKSGEKKSCNDSRMS
ncbi:hypothetical protein BUALT_Bualt15G0127900 [Buddleja alternifolia]|uniref:Uncharacterized protein n=1 Tax=Buddleja alternifolia TaxID=168488 RepID=A0AAV6WMZ3_9LAMI|nr:hypothetical protein BUALT_Bualt15G0127900 [Buddleja alternifolia]